MPVMELRREFCALASVEGANIRLLCRRFQVAPKTGYKWLERYREAGCAGLAGHSRRPLSSPERSSEEIERAVLEVRAAHPAWGGRKIKAVLTAKHVFRPVDPSAAEPADITRFPKLELLSIDKDFGGWAKAQATHFAEGGIFDQIYRPTN